MKNFLSSAWTLALVAGTCLLAILFSHVALGAGAASAPWPRFAVIVVFFWLLHRPRAVPLPMIFAVGLAQDLVSGDVPGAGLLALLAGSAVAMRIAGPLRTMPLVWRWIGFAGFTAPVFALEWALTAAARLTLVPVEPVLVQAGMTFLLYPVISVAMRQVLRIGRTPTRAL